MVAVLNLYLDDSGTRHPDRKADVPPHGHDWFGMGGVLVPDDEQEDAVRDRLTALCTKWNIEAPLHSSEIRNKAKQFRWLRKLPEDKQKEFLGDVGALVTSKELCAIACVIDRPGYNQRYREKYANKRWYLCKTAFTVVVERAVKQARRQKAKLRVMVERSDRDTDRMLRGYYDDLRKDGHPFDQANASKYAPLTADEYRDTLYEFRAKDKNSPLMQIADLVLWPMCIGGYENENYAYRMLRDSSTLIDCRLGGEEVSERGIKYSCFELEAPKTTEPDPKTGLGQPPVG